MVPFDVVTGIKQIKKCLRQIQRKFQCQVHFKIYLIDSSNFEFGTPVSLKNEAALAASTSRNQRFHVRYQVLSVLAPFCQFVETKSLEPFFVLELDLFFGTKYTLDSPRHRSQGKVFCYPKAEDSVNRVNNRYQQQPGLKNLQALVTVHSQCLHYCQKRTSNSYQFF